MPVGGLRYLMCPSTTSTSAGGGGTKHILCYETPGNTRGLCEVVNFGGTASFSNSISLGFHGITVKLGRI